MTKYNKDDARLKKEVWKFSELKVSLKILNKRDKNSFSHFQITVKPVKNDHTKKDHKLVFKTNYGLMQVKSIA